MKSSNIRLIYRTIMRTALLVAITATLPHCYYDSKEELYINVTNDCDTTNVTYAGSVQPIIQENCIGCHGAGFNSIGGGIDLRTYTLTKTNIDAIIGSINHKSGYTAMPKNSSQLSDCNKKIIEIWKTNGFPQN